MVQTYIKYNPKQGDTMPFKTTYFETRQKALAFFNKVARLNNFMTIFLKIFKKGASYFI